MQRLTLGLVLIALLLTPPRLYAAPAPPAAYTVQLSDLPPGSLLMGEVAGTATQLAAQHTISWSAEQLRGLAIGEARLFAIGALTANGPILSVEVGRYISVAAAHAAFLAIVRANTGSAPLAVGAAGDERRGLQRLVPGRVPPMRLGFGADRRGSYVVSVQVAFPSHTFPLARIGPLLALIDTRIQRAH